MSAFYGTERFAIDAKGRVNVPAKMRRGLAPEARDSFVLVKGYDGQLSLYPLDEWAKIEAQLRQRESDPRVRKLQRKLLMDAQDVALDGQGRITIPPVLLESAGLDKEAVLVGQVNRIEIWSPERLAKVDAGDDTSLEQLAREFNL